MLQCWNDDPQLRPTFNELVDKFDKLLSLAHVSDLLLFIVVYCFCLLQGYLQMTSEN